MSAPRSAPSASKYLPASRQAGQPISIRLYASRSPRANLRLLLSSSECTPKCRRRHSGIPNVQNKTLDDCGPTPSHASSDRRPHAHAQPLCRLTPRDITRLVGIAHQLELRRTGLAVPAKTHAARSRRRNALGLAPVDVLVPPAPRNSAAAKQYRQSTHSSRLTHHSPWRACRAMACPAPR